MSEPWTMLRRPAFIAAVATMATAAAGMGWAIRAFGLYLEKKPIYAPEGRVLSSLPIETASWIRHGPDHIVSAEELESLKSTNYLSRTYVRKQPPDPRRPVAIELHAVYYTGMIDTVPHVPDRCFVGGGMLIANAPKVLPLELDRSRWSVDDDPGLPEDVRGRIYTAPLDTRFTSPGPAPLEGNRVRLPRDPESIRMKAMKFEMGKRAKGGGQDVPVYSGYFFIANGGTVANANDVRLLAFNLTNDYAYYLKVQFTSWDVQSEEELAEHAADLLDELLPELMRCVPDWVEVEKGTYPAPAESAGGAATGA